MTPTSRVRARTAAVRERAARLAARAAAAREAHRSLDAAFTVADRDAEVGGGIMAGALAYRLFIWLLPAALVAIAGLGLTSEAAHVEPKDAANSLGLAGIVSSSVAHSAKSSSRWYALLIGIPVLLIATRSLLRALIVVHRLIWTDIARGVRKPTPAATLQLAVVLLLLVGASTLTSSANHASLLAGMLAVLAVGVPYGALWLLVSTRLPHGDAPWRALVPGAIVFGLGVEAVHALTAFVIGPAAESKAGTYGSLGIAAALLLGLFFISRVIVATAVVNATLWERRRRGDGD